MTQFDAKPKAVPVCNLCGHPMRRGTGPVSTEAVIIGLFLILIGAGLCATCLGFIVGVPIVVFGICVCFTFQKGLRCTNCRQFVKTA